MSRSLGQWVAFLGLWLTSYILSEAQPIVPPKLPFCSTPELSSQQKQTFQRQLDGISTSRQTARLSATAAITYVPIRPHIFRRSDGSGGVDLASLNYAMARTNYHFFKSGAGIQFYFCGTTPDYVDNDNAYADFIPDQYSFLLKDVSNALNQYYFNFSSTVTALGYYPGDDITTTRSYIPTFNYTQDNQLDALANYTIPHELGHTFFLYHTHSPANTTDELVTRGAGANCTSAGDLICDTPADPYNMPGATSETINFCTVYTGTITDANGDPYTPPLHNIMSYWPYYHVCGPHQFTTGQAERMKQGLAMRQQHTNYSLDCPPSIVAAPSNLSLTATDSRVVLTWQDNADNEMGYFIERGSFTQTDFVAVTDFVPIGGVGPNMTTFTDTTIIAGESYYYRVRPSNTTTRSPSQLVSLVGNVYTVKAGSWNDPAVWSSNQIPNDTKTVHIRHMVTVPQNYEAKIHWLIYETSVALKLEDGAHITLSKIP